MFELELRVEEEAFVPFVAQVDDGPEEIELIQLPRGRSIVVLGGKVLEHCLAVASQGCAALHSVDLGGRGCQTVAAGQRLFLGHLPQLESFELLTQKLELPFQLFDPIFVRWLFFRSLISLLRFAFRRQRAGKRKEQHPKTDEEGEAAPRLRPYAMPHEIHLAILCWVCATPCHMKFTSLSAL